MWLVYLLQRYVGGVLEMKATQLKNVNINHVKQINTNKYYSFLLGLPEMARC